MSLFNALVWNIQFVNITNRHGLGEALLYIHDHLINAIGSQKLSCLCLLDLSAAFDTIDYNILITRLSSWFGIQGSVLNWFESYLTTRSLSLTYKVLTTSQPDYLHNLISVQSTGRTRSSFVVTLARPSVSSSLQITNRSFRYASRHLWNQLPSSFRQPHYSHHLRSHHLSLPRPFTPDLKPISFTNPFLHSHSYSFQTVFTDS